MMLRISLHLTMLLAILLAGVVPASAREGDTLLPIQIDAPGLQTWPQEMLNEDDVRFIESRIREAHNSGVPLAVRIVDLTLPEQQIPFQVRQYAREDHSQPISAERQQAMVESWANTETVETSEGADDGFILLVLVPEDRTQTQAIWWIGPNALPLNGLTQENILATHGVMNEQFAAGNMPNGVFLGLSEFSHSIQFGVPERLVRSELQDALLWATIPMAIATTLAGLSIPVLAMWLSRRTGEATEATRRLTPFEAGALQLGRARQEIPAAMLLDSVHRGEITPMPDGGFRLNQDASNPAVDSLRSYARQDGVISTDTMYEIEAICVPVRDEIEHQLAAIGAMTPYAKSDRSKILLAMGVTAFLAVLAVVPSVMSMSAIGVFAIVVGIIGIAIGWWWLSYRSYTTPVGEEMLFAWLETATSPERAAFDLVVHQDLLTDQHGGSDIPGQTQMMRRLRGLGSA